MVVGHERREKENGFLWLELGRGIEKFIPFSTMLASYI